MPRPLIDIPLDGDKQPPDHWVNPFDPRAFKQRQENRKIVQQYDRDYRSQNDGTNKPAE